MIDEVAEEQLAELRARIQELELELRERADWAADQSAVLVGDLDLARADRDRAIEDVKLLRAAIRPRVALVAVPGCCVLCDAWLATAEYDDEPRRD